ncbi:MAG: hypothetical protein HUU38_28445 [Anaerolineales bacterium]|nr:hypothetical protein [Anaerolineales bacterium]
MRRLANFDGLDTVLLFFGLPTAYAAGGVPGLFVGGLLFGAQMVLRKTPVLPRTAQALDWSLRAARGDRKVLAQVFQFLEDETAIVGNPMPGQAPRSVLPSQVIPPVQPIGAKELAYKPVYRGLEKLPPLLGYQIVIYGPTKSGKSSVIKALLIHRQEAELLILDPHYEPGNWPSRAVVVGPGLNWTAIDHAINYAQIELQTRYHQLASQPRGAVQFRPLYLIVDEMSALTMEIPDAGKRLFNLAQQGRKVDIWTILTPHSTEVEQMGAQGRGNARENSASIEMPFVPEEEKYKPRIVTLYYGNPRRKDNSPVGRFIVPTPKVYTGTPTLNPAWIARAHPVSNRVPEKTGHRVPAHRHTLEPGRHRPSEAEFGQKFGRDSELAGRLALYLLQQGYGVRKVSAFLPFANDDARVLVNTLRAQFPHLAGERPTPGSPAEIQLVQRLCSLGAPLRRIAVLLDGNDGENLARIEKYI